jgi:hypothetical protein
MKTFNRRYKFGINHAEKTDSPIADFPNCFLITTQIFFFISNFYLIIPEN